MTVTPMVPEVVTLLRQILETLESTTHKPTVQDGFFHYDKTVYCDIAEGNADGWYTLDKATAITQPPVFIGQLVSISFPKVESQEQTVTKFHLVMRTHAETVTFESNYDCCFSKTVLSALAIASAEALKQPIQLTTYVKPLNSGNQTLAVSLQAGGDPLVSDWRHEDDWRSISQVAMHNVKIAVGQ